VIAPRGPFDGIFTEPFVLQAAVDVVRLLHVDADGVVLRERQVIDDVPRFAEVPREGQAPSLARMRCFESRGSTRIPW